MRAIVWAAALMALAGQVCARTLDRSPETAPTEDVAEARQEADRLIAAANAGALFENITDGELAAIRHLRSGLVCIFSPGDPRNLVFVYPARPGGPAAGDDVSCRAGIDDGTFVSVYATRYPQQPTEQQAIDMAVAELGQAWTDVRTLPSEPGIQISVQGSYPNPLVYGFTGSLQDTPMQSYILVHNVGAWTFKGRVSGPPYDANVSVIGSWVYSMGLPGNWAAHRAAR